MNPQRGNRRPWTGHRDPQGDRLSIYPDPRTEEGVARLTHRDALADRDPIDLRGERFRILQELERLAHERRDPVIWGSPRTQARAWLLIRVSRLSAELKARRATAFAGVGR
jgi:hypothetical protein